MKTLLLGAAFAAATVLAAPAVDPHNVNILKGLLESGKTKLAIDFLEVPEARPAFEGDPGALAAVCSEEAVAVGRLSCAKEEARKLATLLEEMTDAAVAAAPDRADAHGASSDARLAAGRIAVNTGEKDVPATRWIAAADSLEKVYGIEPRNGAPLAAAAEALLEGTGRTGADVAALTTRATALMAKALEKHPDSVHVLKSASVLDVDRARKLLDAKDKAGADALLVAAFARLAPLLKGTATDVGVATAHNLVVDFVKSRAKDIKTATGEYLVAPARMVEVLDVQIPMGRHWSKDGSTVHQFTAAFDALRSFDFGAYRWDTNWQLADGSMVGGYNLAGLASNEFATAVRAMKKVQAKRAPVRGRLNKWVEDGLYYEVSGIDANGNWVFAKTWFFKSKVGHMTSFRFTMIERREGMGPDAGSQLFLDSVKEVPKK